MKRVLVTIVGQGSVVHIIRTGILEGMRTFCEPVVAILWNQEDLIEELKMKGFEVYIIPVYETSNYYKCVRDKLNKWYLGNILKSPSTKIQKKYLSQFLSFKKRSKQRLIAIQENIKNKIRPQRVKEFLLKEQNVIKKENSWKQYSEWLSYLRINGLFTVTPFLEEVELIARILKQKNLPVIASIHSFDNVTKRGWSSLSFDHYIVWNKYNKEELQRIYSKITDQDITIAGAPQFDFHFQKARLSKEQWKNKMGLPPDKKIILYSGGPASLFPQEPQFLKDLLDAFSNEMIKDKATVFFRSHPHDTIERWKMYAGESPFIKYDHAPNGKHKLDHANVTYQDIDQLISTLQFTDVHINLCSTMTVDGCAFYKPQIGPAYDEQNKINEHLLKQMYFQEHFVPIINSGAVKLAKSKEELIQLINQALQEPEAFTQNSIKCLQEIITYTDGQSAMRVLSTLKNFFT